MKLTKKSVAGTVGVAALLASAGLGLTSVAQAAPANTTKPPVAAPAVASVSPDTGTAAETAAGTETASETGPSDGNDGGHADAPGVDVNHEGGADEK